MNIFRKRISFSAGVIIIFLMAIPLMDFSHHNYADDEGVIIWDIKSYYAYLPAIFIYNDLSLDYVKADIKKFSKWVWPITTPTGNQAILTTMGLSIMYSPFFLIAHEYTRLTEIYKADGYSYPYHVALTFSAYVYFILALLILRKLLLKYFTDLTTSVTLIAIGAGTNLLYYVTYEAPMSHGYNFFLIVLFIYLLDQWYRSFAWKYTVFLGLTAGLISLVRPTNILVLVLIPLYNVNSFHSLKGNIRNLITKWPKLVVMAIFFILVWLPQFFYWHFVAGKYLYFSYGEVDSAFFFNNPQIIGILFSYGKGWFIYTPIMLLATIGIYFLFKQKHKMGFAILLYFLINLYLLSSWWSWWFGGGYSNRAFIDFYGLMAFPLAALLEQNWRRSFIKIILLSLVGILTFYNLFQIQQYRKGSLNWFWMNKEAYWESFLRLKPTCKFWNILNHPDIRKARQGIYETMFFIDSKISYEDLYQKVYEKIENDTILNQTLKQQALSDTGRYKKLQNDYIRDMIKQGLAKEEYKELRVDYLKGQMKNCKTWKKEIERKAKRKGISTEQMATIEAERIFNMYSQKYIKEYD